MKLNKEIQDLIVRASGDMEKIKHEYDNSLQQEEISSDLRISIKNCLENIRSSLDYLANQIFEENCTKKGNSKIYFPIYFENKTSFEKFMKKTFPDLKKVSSKLYTELESHQYYNDKSIKEWMKDLVVLVNENKHRKLSAQTKTERKQLDISSGNVGISLRGNASIQMGTNTSISVGGRTIYGGQTISPDNPFIQGDPALNITRTIWLNFIFDELKKSVIPTISNIIEGTQKIIDDFKDL